MVLLEVCIDSVAGARAAAAGGAGRVELCSALVEGGVTPSLGLIRRVREALGTGSVQLMVLVRPRGADFVYSPDEMEVMLADIEACKQLGADGVVLGCLLPDGRIDSAATCRLVAAAHAQGLSVTFHRAFDVCRDQSEGLEELISLGITRVLTSGGFQKAQQGQAAIAQLVRQAAGRISVLAGGGVRSSNAGELVAATGVQELHSAAKTRFSSSMQFRRPDLPLASTAAPSDYEWSVTDAGEVKALLRAATKAAAAAAAGSTANG